jgi:hypothetical protein
MLFSDAFCLAAFGFFLVFALEKQNKRENLKTTSDWVVPMGQIRATRT